MSHQRLGIYMDKHERFHVKFFKNKTSQNDGLYAEVRLQHSNCKNQAW